MDEPYYDTADVAPRDNSSDAGRAADPSVPRRKVYEVMHRRGAVGRTIAEPDEVLRWTHRCPLWLWRVEQRLNRETAAAILGVSERTIDRWEHGANYPALNHMERLVDLLGPDTIVEWAEWLAARPVKTPTRRKVQDLADIDTAAAEMARQLEELAALLDEEGQ